MSLATKYRPTQLNDVVGQEHILSILQEEIANNDIKHNYLFEGLTGAGKAQPLYSKLLTPNGYVKMEDIRIGDEVYGEDGNPHKILGIFPQGKKKVYEITFSDNTTCRCTDEHLWKLSCDNRKSWICMELKDILNTPLKKRNSSWKYHIPVTKPINYSKKDLPIDPWLFGILLGDGGFTDNSISVSLFEEDVESRVREVLIKDNFELSYYTKNHTQRKDFRIKDKLFDKNTSKLSRKGGIFGNRLNQHIYDLGLLNHKSEEKFIPRVYLTSSYADRLSLLQGIFDSDGYLSVREGKHGSIGSSPSISTSSRQFATNIIELIQSLGGTGSCSEKTPFYTYKGKRRQGLTCYIIHFKLPKGVCYCSSEKHLKKYRIPMYEPYRTIRNIEYIGEEECQCIYIDSPSHLYLTDNMIVTHNTTISKCLAKALNANVIEIDSASHNTSEDMLGIIESVKTKPIGYDNTVLILDEAHCFGTKAISKLLLLLESLPNYLYIIMCTTEGGKILDTIKNRCECFTFLPVPIDDITKRLEYICKEEGFTVENSKLLAEIAKSGNGSVRQAIANLELIAPNITVDRVKVIYDCSYDNFLNIVYSISDNNLNDIIGILNKVKDANKFSQSFFSFLLDVKIYLNTKDMSLTTLPSEYEEDIKGLTPTDSRHIEKMIDRLLNLLTEVKQSPIMKELLLANIMQEVKGV